MINKLSATPPQRVKPPRIQLTDQTIRNLMEQVYQGSIPELAKRSRLPYALVYNIIRGRVKSISTRHYRMLFGQPPPSQDAMKVDGTFFREMVDLWLYLNDGANKSDLYKEFHQQRSVKKADCRIFNGQIATVDARLEKRMLNKFSDAGLSPDMLRQWIDEYRQTSQTARVPYVKIRTALNYLRETIGLNPTTLLNQLASRYESGELQSVSVKTYHRVTDLQRRVAAAIEKGDHHHMDQIREHVLGPKPGYTLYADIREELAFLKAHAGIGPKRYLGRSSNMYESGKAKRITSDRAARIRADCRALIEQRPDLPLQALPPVHRKGRIMPLLALMVLGAARMLSRKEGIAFEKQILRPAHAKNEYESGRHGFTQFDRASTALGMKKKAFDLMVSENCEIFKGIGRYARRWYLPDLYLKELASKDTFDLITAKYELMASSIDVPPPANTCMI